MAAEPTAVASGGLDGLFHFTKWGTTLRRDMLAGLTTFIVMSYIIFVNPSILGLGGKGLPFAAVLTSTCLVAGVMTIVMGAFTNRAYAIAPGMGLNAVVAFSLVLGQGLTFPQAMGLIFLEGVAISILVLTGFREAIFKAIPLELKKAIVVGIGFFIPVHRHGRRRHRDRRQRHTAHPRHIRRRPGARDHLRPHRDDHHAHAPLARRRDPRESSSRRSSRSSSTTPTTRRPSRRAPP